MKTKSFVIFSLGAIILVSCAPASTLIPAETLISTPIPTFTPIPQTSTQKPLSIVTVTQTIVAKLEKWMEYENALAAIFLPSPYLPGKGLCEWEILGQSKNEVYVWAMCQVSDSSEGSAMSAPAVIYLAEDGSIENVKVPGDGSQYAVDIRKLFPKDLQEKILSHSINTDEMWSHIQLRHKNPEPPLIVESGVSLP